MTNLYFELLIKDETYRKIGSWKFQKRDAAKFMNIINDQYGLGLLIKDLKMKDNLKESDDLAWMK
jgi:hypothetical protein